MHQTRLNSKSKTEIYPPLISEFRNKHRNSLKLISSDPKTPLSKSLKHKHTIKDYRLFRSPLSSTKTISDKSFFPDISNQMHRVSSETYLDLLSKCITPESRELGSPKGKSPTVSIDSFLSYMNTKLTPKTISETLTKKKRILDENRKKLRDMSGITQKDAEIARKRRWQNSRIRSEDVHYSARDLKKIILECRGIIKHLS